MLEREVRPEGNDQQTVRTRGREIEPNARDERLASPAEAVLPLGGGVPQHLASPLRLQELQDRVNETYGAFGVRAKAADIDERRVLSDDGWKRSVGIIAGISAASAFLAFASHPGWSSSGEW